MISQCCTENSNMRWEEDKEAKQAKATKFLKASLGSAFI
jgi:hypothetical protein